MAVAIGAEPCGGRRVVDGRLRVRFRVRFRVRVRVMWKKESR